MFWICFSSFLFVFRSLTVFSVLKPCINLKNPCVMWYKFSITQILQMFYGFVLVVPGCFETLAVWKPHLIFKAILNYNIYVRIYIAVLYCLFPKKLYFYFMSIAKLRSLFCIIGNHLSVYSFYEINCNFIHIFHFHFLNNNYHLSTLINIPQGCWFVCNWLPELLNWISSHCSCCPFILICFTSIRVVCISVYINQLYKRQHNQICIDLYVIF